MCLCSFKCIEMSVSLFLMKMQHNHIFISYLWLKKDVGTKCREAFKVSTRCQSQREAVWFDRSVRGAGPLQTNQIHFFKLPGSGGYAGVFISHHHTSQGSSAVWYTDCTGMHGRCFLPGRWETMQTKTHTTYVNTMVRKMCQFVLFVLNGQKQVTSSDPSFGSTHFHRNSLCWREKQAVGQPAGIFACKQAKWVSQI